MTQCTTGLIEQYLISYGWSFQRQADEALKTGFQGRDQSFPLRITHNDTWVSFTIEPYLNLNIDWESWPEIATSLLELNSRSYMVRLSVCEGGRILLGLDSLAKHFCFEAFSSCVGILGYYADHYYDEILTRLDQLGYRYTESLKLLT